MAKLPKLTDKYCFIFAKVNADKRLEVSKNILVAPLNWGLGHATRCIPVIRELEYCGFTPIIASDGQALQLLKLEFPHLQFFELPSYQIKYPKNGNHFRLMMLKNLPKIWQAINAERKLVEQRHKQYFFAGIISDNRFGVRVKNIPSVYITHQVRVLSGFTTYFSSLLHKIAISKFTECWIPDYEFAPNLSFGLGHSSDIKIKTKYIGALSRFKVETTSENNDLLIILSGPEPQRSMLQKILIDEVQKFEGNVIFVSGKVEAQQTIIKQENVTYYNFMTSAQLQRTINQSQMILCRSGYSSAMDLSALQKKCYFIPTPGQFEQEYLARKYQEAKYAPFSEQKSFKIADLEEVGNYHGFPNKDNNINWRELFSLFNGK